MTLDELEAIADGDRLESAVSTRLLPLGAGDFRREAHTLLDAAEALVSQGRMALAERLRAAILRATRAWAQRAGVTSAYAEEIARRGRAFAEWSSGRR